MKFIAVLFILVIACTQDVSAPLVGEVSRCPQSKTQQAVVFSTGGSRTYVLEVASCVYEVSYRPDARLIEEDTVRVTLNYSRSVLVAEAARLK